MTHQQILEKAIQKAIDNGWEAMNTKHRGLMEWHVYPAFDPSFGNREPFVQTVVPGLPGIFERRGREIYLDRDFAKALWGESDNQWSPTKKQWNGLWDYDGGYMPDFNGQPWEFHLTQMVIADDPIEYLGEHLN